MSNNENISTDDGLEPQHIPPHEMLGRIEPIQQLKILQLPPRASAELDRVRNLQIGGAVLIGMIGLVALPFGQRMVRFAFIAGIIFMIVGLLSSRTNVLIRNHLARRRAKKLGEISYTSGELITPGPGGSLQFNLNDPSTMLRSWQRVEVAGGPPVTITSLLIAQDGQRVILFSDEASSSEEGRDYNFHTEHVPDFNILTSEDRVRIPLRGVQELSRFIDRDFGVVKDMTDGK